MAHLAYRGSSGIQHFSGSRYINPQLGTHKFCIRTGTGLNDVIKYGLTTDEKASEYCGLKFKVSGMDARIGRYEGFSSTESTLKTTSGRQYYSQSYRTYKGNHQVSSSTTYSGLSNFSYQTSSSSSTIIENRLSITEFLMQNIIKQYETYYTSKCTITSGYYSSVSSLISTITSRISKTIEQSGNPTFNF